jgi:hypothetical protein
MGYASTLYGVQLASLQASIGSNDQQLLERCMTTSRPEPVANVPAAVFLADGGIVWNEARLSPEELKAELAKIEPGTKIPAIDQRSGDFMEKFKTSEAIMTVIQAAMRERMFGFQWEVSKENSDEFPLEEAISDLIKGVFTQKDEDNTFQYGYALERLCLTIGTHLGTLEGELLLRHLKLKSPLSRKKNPVKLPKSDDVPEISFLSSEDVRAELARVNSLDLAFPADLDVEGGRREYASIVAKAAGLDLAIVAFGY